MALLSQLWCGEVQPACVLGENNEDIRHLNELIQKNRLLLEQGLMEEQKQRLARCMECVEERQFLLSEAAFCDGVRLGLRLAAEALL